MYYNEQTIVYYDGKFIKATEANGNLYDQTLHYGYGVFEGIRAYETKNGVRIFKAIEHYARLKFSADAIGAPFPYSIEELVELSYAVLEKNNLSNAYLRPLLMCTPNMALTKGKESRLLITAWEWPAYLGDKHLELTISSFRRPNPSGFKIHAKITGHYINSILACQEAKDRGFDEALLLDNDGFVAEGPGANVFVEKDNVLYTPKLGNILPGITRATILSLCSELGIEVRETQIKPEELIGADSAFYCGTAAEVIALASVDKIPFTKPWSESIGYVLQQAYKKLVLEEDYKAVLKVA